MLITTATRLPLIMACNGSYKIPPAFPKTEGDRTDRDEGDAAHWLAKAVFDGTHTLSEMGDRKAPNGVHITTDMCDFVGEYLSQLNCGEMEVETSLANGLWQINARADHILFDGAKLTIDDFKYGWRIVEPEMNWTLIAHSLGFCIRNAITPATIDFRIHQPRPHHRLGTLRTWSIDYNELMALYVKLDTTLSVPADELRTGPHCGSCFANAHCPAARKAELNVLDTVEESVFTDDVSDDLLAYEIDLLRGGATTLKHRLDALEELAKHRITNGAVVPNFYMESQYAHRSFKPGLDAALLTALTGEDMAKSGTVTPAEAERRLVARGMKKKQAEAIINSLAHRPNTGIKLVREDANARANRLLNGSK